MPLVRIDMWPGRTREQKKNLIRKVTDAVVESLDVKPNAVTVLLNEVDQADWAIGGVTRDQ